MALASDLLRPGVTIGATGNHSSGITVKLVNEDVEVTLDDKTITRLLLRHLLPRFRAQMNGKLEESP
jgi:V/A-type H+-transporting ATPase subunit E